MKSKKLGKIYLLSFVALLVLGAGTSLLFVNGPLGEVFFQNQNFPAAVELVLIFVWMWVSLCLVQNPKLSAGLAVVGGAPYGADSLDRFRSLWLFPASFGKTSFKVWRNVRL